MLRSYLQTHAFSRTWQLKQGKSTKKLSNFLQNAKKLYPAEIIFMESQVITPESQELKYMAVV